MDESFRELVEHVALKDGGSSRPLHDQIIYDPPWIWAFHEAPVLPSLINFDQRVVTFDQLTMAFVAGDLIIGHATTMN